MPSSSATIQHATAVHLQTEENDPRQARIELLELVEKFNQLLDALGTAAFKNIGVAEGNIITLGEGGNLPQAIAPNAAVSIPTATILDFFASRAPAGWLEAKGQGIQIANGIGYFPLYQYLFEAAINENNALPVFETQQQLNYAKSQENAQQAWENNLVVPIPDLRGRTRIANNSEQGDSQKLVGEKLGEEKVSIVKAHLPSIQLSIGREQATTSGTNSTIRYIQDGLDQIVVSDTHYDLANKTELLGLGLPHNNIQPSFVVLTCIKL